MITKRPLLLTLLLPFILWACEGKKKEYATAEANPPAKGFNLEASDQKAITIADEVMEAMGGRKNWDNTRYLCWKFFGRRELVWDKWTGNVRIDHDDLTYLVNVNSNEGNVYQNGLAVQVSKDSLRSLIDRGKRIWINDSYWLVMPFKLKDSGVTLKYRSVEDDMNGNTCDKLELTFSEVGVTPQNKYEVWVDQNSKLVSQWAYYRNYSDTVAGFTMPWLDYKKKGKIMLSGDRGRAQLENIMVFGELPESVFTSPEKPDLSMEIGS